MRSMTREEIQGTLTVSNWASICTVGATPFMDDEGRQCFMISPRALQLYPG